MCCPLCHPALFDPIDRLEENPGDGEYFELEEIGVVYPKVGYSKKNPIGR